MTASAPLTADDASGHGYRPPILVIGPLPPPMGGTEHQMAELLKSSLQQRFTIIHINSRVRSSNLARGYVDRVAVAGLFKLCASIVGATLTHRPKAAYFPIGSNTTGFLRDAIVILTLRSLGRRVVAHYRGGHFAPFYAHAGSLMKWFIRFVISQVDQLVVQGHGIVASFAGIHPQPSRIAIVPNGIRPDALTPATHEGSAERQFTILYLGNLSFVKGFYDLIVAYRELRVRFPQLALEFGGEQIDVSAERNVLREYFPDVVQRRMASSAEEIAEFVAHAADHNARHLGLVSGPAKREAFARASAYVLPSYSEGFSMGVLEAMAAGLPIVATRVGAMTDVVRDGVNGYTVNPGDTDALAARIAGLVSAPAEAQAMGRRSRDLVESTYNVDRIAEMLRQHLEGSVQPA
jgi:glycosyltransferase involved in cell wall biosynthesis